MNCKRCNAPCKYSENPIGGRYILLDDSTGGPHDRVCTNKWTYKPKPMMLRQGPGFNYLTKEEMFNLKRRIDEKHEKYLQDLRAFFKSPYV